MKLIWFNLCMILFSNKVIIHFIWKKIFFYEIAMQYESKLNKKSDIKLFWNKICEPYSAVFKQDKLTIADFFDENWNKNESYALSIDYNNFNNDNPDLNKELCFIENKRTLINFIKSKIDVFYRAKVIKDKSYIKNTEKNILNVIYMLNSLERKNSNLILLGKDCTGKKALFELSFFISETEIIEVDNSFSIGTIKTQEQFINQIINPFIVNVIHRNKKSVLFVPSTIKVNYVKENIIKLLDKKEIINNFFFIDTQNYGEITEEETMERLSKNISFCFDVVPKSDEYFSLFIDYPSISKSSSIVYFQSWKNYDMTSFMNISIKELDIIQVKYILIFAIK